MTAAVRDAIGKFCEVPTIDFDTVGRPEIPVYDPERPIAPPQPHYNPDYNPFEVRKRKEESGNREALATERDARKWKEFSFKKNGDFL